MLTIRRYQPSDHAAVYELHKTALLAAGAYIGGGHFNDDLDQIESVYLGGMENFSSAHYRTASSRWEHCVEPIHIAPK